MIEKNVTQLDQDFITVWSKYFLNDFDDSDIQEEIKLLAEQGQLNAIHSWYLANKIGDNYTIDNQIINLMHKGSHTYDELWTISTYLGNDERNNQGRQEIEEEIKELTLKNDFFAFENRYDLEELDKVNRLRIRIEDFESYSVREKAREKIEEEYKFSVLLWQRKLEMDFGNSYVRIFKGATNPKLYNRFQGEVDTVRATLKKAYKMDSTNDVIAYHLAKNIKLFSEVIYTTKKELKLADNIFEKLSNRPLSIKQMMRR